MHPTPPPRPMSVPKETQSRAWKPQFCQMCLDCCEENSLPNRLNHSEPREAPWSHWVWLSHQVNMEPLISMGPMGLESILEQRGKNLISPWHPTTAHNGCFFFTTGIRHVPPAMKASILTTRPNENSPNGCFLKITLLRDVILHTIDVTHWKNTT